MAYVRGKDGQITIAGSAIGQLRSWSLEHSVGTVDVSTMAAGLTTTPYIPTQFATTYNLSGTADCYFDADDARQIAAITNLVAGTTVAISIFPETGESVAISAAMITGVSINSSVDGLVDINISFTASGGTIQQLG
jgi:uncharacterized membrane protein